MELIMHLLISLLGTIKQDKNTNAYSLLIEKVKNVVDANLNTKLNVKTLAEMLNLSREHLTRTFHSETGWKLYQYILHQKMLLASDMIRMGKLSIKEVAASLGFVSLAHFSRAFKKQRGISPIKFRIQKSGGTLGSKKN